MTAEDMKAFYDATTAIGKEKLDRSEFEARHNNLEARVIKLELEQDTRYDKLLEMIQQIKDAIAAKDRNKLNVLFASCLSFVGGGGLLGILVAFHVIH